MPDTWLLLNTALTISLLVGVVRLQRTQRRQQREVQARPASMALLLEQAWRGDSVGGNGLTPAEERALATRRRLARREARLLPERHRSASRPASYPHMTDPRGLEADR